MLDTGYITNPIVFIIDVVFSSYILAVLIRFILQTQRADFYNPIAQFLVKITNPPLKPLRRIVPGIGGIDNASILLLIILQMSSTALTLAIGGGGVPPFGALFFISLAALVSLVINTFLFSILIQVVISWVNPNSYNPALGLLNSICEPVLRPFRRIIPAVGGFDLSPLVAMVALQVLNMLLVPPIRNLAFQFT